MKKMKFLVSQLYLLTLLALPFISSSCNDDDEPKAEITSLGIEDGATVNVGQIIKLEAQINNTNTQGGIEYNWEVNGESVSHESNYTFMASKKGTHTITLNITNNTDNFQKSISINAQMYPSSFYVVNEGKSSGSVNRYHKGEWNYKIISELGYPSTVGVVDENYMYIVSQNSPFLVRAKLSDHSIVDRIRSTLGPNGQANNFCIINDQTGILTTTNGAFKVDLNPLTLGEKLNNMDVRNDKEDIYKTENYLFILSKGAVKVYDINDLSFKKEIGTEIKTGFALTKDGMLWAANGNKLTGINTTTLNSKDIELPDELKIYYNQWAYTPTGLCASTTENVLYFVNTTQEGSTIYGKNIYKFDIRTESATPLFSTPAENMSIYGAGIQVDPSNGDVYLFYTEGGWGEHYLNTYIYVIDGVTGAQKAIIDYSGEYWFPSTITFR